MVLALALSATPAPVAAFALRAPQVQFATAPLQAYFNAVDAGMNAAADQLDAQVWDVTLAPAGELTLMLADHAATGAIGVYDATTSPPQLIPIFAPGMLPGSYTDVIARPGNLILAAFDKDSNFLGETSYSGVDGTHLGFYYQDAQGTFFSQDARNGGSAQALTYPSLASGCPGYPCDEGRWYECFAGSRAGPASTFDNAMFWIMTIEVLPAHPASWGSVKALYR